MGKSVKALDLLQLIDKKKFNELCQKWEIDKSVRRLSTQQHILSLVMAHLFKLESLREIEQATDIPKSTLCDANCKRHFGFYQELSEIVLSSIKKKSKNRKLKRAIGNLLAVDASTCRVHGSLARDWLWKARSSSGNKACVGFHAIWNLTDQSIDDYRATPGKTMETTIARQLKITPHNTYVFDRAYRELAFWWNITNQRSHFVSRLTGNSIDHEKKKQILKKAQDRDGVLYEGKYRPSKTALSTSPKVPKDIEFRYVMYKDPETKKVFDFVTSHQKISGQEVADIYKQRWSVELLFKWLKGHLNIRYIASRNKNSVKIQIAIAVLVQLLVRLYSLVNKYRGTLWECLRDIQTQLTKRAVIAEFGEVYPRKLALVPSWGGSLK